jgi:uncharacterized protein (TIGR03435 family)
MRFRPNSASSADADLNSPDRLTLFKVFEQLGLRMESKLAPVDVYVVDSIHSPTEN